MRYTPVVFLLLLPLLNFAQVNCNVYNMNGEESCYKACELATIAADYQGSRQSQMQFDSAIQMCPALDYAYHEKSVPYLKRGDFITWKKLMDAAVALNPAKLAYTGWCRYQFVRDYRGAIQDLERLDSLVDHDIGYSVNGDYHLNIARALCYKAIGERQKAIEIMEQQLSKKDYSPWTYDYLHLGVLKLEVGDLAGGLDYLQKSIAYNDYLAENYYYLGLIYKKQNKFEEFKQNMLKAKTFYLKGYRRFDPYTTPMDKIFLQDIEKELLSE